MVAADPSSAIIARLENSSDYRGLYRQISSFLLPFEDLIPLDSHDPAAVNARKKTTKKAAPKKKKKSENDTGHLRSLAKQFLPFLSRILKLLPSIFKKFSRGGGDGGREEKEGEDDVELFCVYNLALDCLQCILPCLAGKPYSVQLQRSRLVCCLELCGKYAEAEAEALSLLESLSSMVGTVAPAAKRVQRGKTGKESCHFLPVHSGDCAEDPELALLVVEIVISLIGCSAKSSTRDDTVYDRVVILVEEVQPWLSVLDAETFTKCQTLLVNAMYKCSLFIARESMHFDCNLVKRLCILVLRECSKSPLRDQLPKIARRICSSFDLKWDTRYVVILDALRSCVESMLCKCKLGVVNTVNDFFEFVCYCVENCSDASADICRGAYEILYKGRCDFEVFPAVTSTLNLYAAGLFFSANNGQDRNGDSIAECPNDGSLVIHLLDNEECPRLLSNSLSFLGCHFRISELHDGVLSIKDPTNEQHLDQDLAAVSGCTHRHGKLSLVSFLYAMEFSCKLLGEYVNTTWKHSISQSAIYFPPDIACIQDAFHQFCDLYFIMCRCIKTSNKQRERLHESHGVLLHSAVAALRISFGAGRNQQKSVACISNLISSRLMKPQDLKFLVSSLYNTGASLYNIKLVEQAAVSLHLCCTAVWTHVKLLCQMLLDEPKATHNVSSLENTIKDVVADACVKSAAILDVLRQCRDDDMRELIVSGLLSWASARDMLETLPSPTNLVKSWVKTACKGFEEANTKDGVPSLFSLLSSHTTTMSKKTMGMILEQELLAYEEMVSRNPNLCHTMQLKVIDILLLNVYVTQEYFPQRANILVKKGRVLRASGIEGLSSCIQCLSEAISLLNEISGASVENSSLYHQLAVTYCLHAQCSQEANEDFKVILHDVRSALNMWSNANLSVSCPVDDRFDLVTGNTVQLLCNIADLMSLKGFLGFQYEIHKLTIILWKLKNVPVERCIAMLWRDRRLNHALCSLPVDEDFIKNTSQYFSVQANSLDFWLSCLKDMPSAVVGLLQKLLPSDFILPQLSIYNSDRSIGYKVTIEEVEAVASSLVSNVPVASHSAFAAGHLYYDLSERLYLDGRFYKALKYAREALQLRKKLLQRKFKYSSKRQNAEAKNGQSWSNCEHVYLEAVGSVVTEVWPDSSTSQNSENPIISPWNVLRCYLESIFQVGVVLEEIGDGAEAEILFQTGKKISTLQGLPLCEAAFASQLGQVYCKKQLWDLAKNDFESAKNVLHENDMIISCKCCKLAMEVKTDMRIGDLGRSLHESSSRTLSSEHLVNILGLYRSTFEKLANANLRGSLNIPDGSRFADDGARMGLSSSLCQYCSQSSARHDNSHVAQKHSEFAVISQPTIQSERPPVITGAKRSKKPSKKSQSKQSLTSDDINTKRTRSCNHSSCSETRYVSTERNQGFPTKNCWACFLLHVTEAGSMGDIIYLSWESQRRRLLLKLLSRIGRCMGSRGGIHDLHEYFLQSISFLFLRDPCDPCHHFALQDTYFLELIGEEFSGDIFSIERAVILYNISWFFVKNCFSENSSRSKCCYLSNIRLQNVISWLLRAFILTREVPLLFQKVAQLLATLFLLSTLGGSYAFAFDSMKSLSANHWAAYFHQASIGTILHHQYLSIIKGKTCNQVDEGLLGAGSAEGTTDTSTSLRIVPEKLVQLEEFVRDFFASLPNFTVVCISFLEGDYINVLGEALLLTSFVPAWMFLSRLNSNGQPISILLPVDFVNEDSPDDDTNSYNGSISEIKDPTKAWQCPWSHTVVDYVAPQFKSMLEENYDSLSNIIPDSYDTQKSRSKWWLQRTRLNNRLSKFLRTIEDSWLGPWRCLLLGERSDSECLNMVLTRLARDLKCKSKFETNPNLLKAIVEGSSSPSDAEACFRQLLLYKGFFGRGKCCGEGRFRAFSSSSDLESENILQFTRQLILDASGGLLEQPDREPIILVLDADVQMLPWENLPMIRKQEVYRMPSVGSICATLRGIYRNKGATAASSIFPLVDPLDTYYLLNPSGDLSSTQAEFEEWFRTQKWQGKAGHAPTIEELAAALQSHDLFIYFGHGSGTQYIPGHEIRKLHKCAATLLMGCSSGSLTLKGCYAPQGAPLSYLFAGSPAVIANLWEVTDKDIDRFGKSILDSWLHEESNSACCSRCSVAKEFGCLKIDSESNGKSLKSRRMAPRSKKFPEVVKSDCRNCSMRNRIISSMSRARDACKLPILIGASPVCYGVPTVIRKNNNSG